MPRAQKPTGKSRHDPLHVQLDGDEVEAKYGRVSKPGKRRKSNKAEADDGDDDEVRHYLLPLLSFLTLFQVILDPKTSKRIFELARDQQEELGLVDAGDEDDTDSEAAPSAFQRPRMDVDEEEEEEEDEDLQGYDEDVEEVFVSNIKAFTVSIS